MFAFVIGFLVGGGLVYAYFHTFGSVAAVKAELVKIEGDVFADVKSVIARIKAKL